MGGGRRRRREDDESRMMDVHSLIIESSYNYHEEFNRRTLVPGEEERQIEKGKENQQDV